jgi:hypothetical protein
MQRLYAYADDSDLAEIEQALYRDFESFASSWGVESVRLRNTKAPILADQSLPDWNIGFSVETPQLETRQLGLLVRFLASISKKYGRRFVVGTWDQATSATEDLCFIGEVPSESDVNLLCNHFRAAGGKHAEA